MSQTAVSRIWRAFGFKPHLTESYKLSADPQFIDKVRDIVGLYLNPPDAAIAKQRLGIDSSTPTVVPLPTTTNQAGATSGGV